MKMERDLYTDREEMGKQRKSNGKARKEKFWYRTRGDDAVTLIHATARSEVHKSSRKR